MHRSHGTNHVSRRRIGLPAVTTILNGLRRVSHRSLFAPVTVRSEPAGACGRATVGLSLQMIRETQGSNAPIEDVRVTNNLGKQCV